MRSLLAITVALASGCAFEGPVGSVAGTDGGGDGDECEVSCVDGQLSTCPDREPVECPLGCAADGAACARFEVSNGAGQHGLDESELGAWELSGVVVIDTDTGEVTGPGGARAPGAGVDGGVGFAVVGDAAVFAVAGLKVAAGARVSARGRRPLIINSLGDVDIRGVIDVSGGLFECGAAPARACAGPGGGDGASSGVAAGGCAPGGDGDEGDFGAVETGGGGGGSSAMPGARGGDADDGSPGGPGGTAAGDECPALDLVPLIGGSGGGAGGDDGSSPAEGGGGGGAVQISSQTRIAITGTATELAGVLAGGAGGAGGGGSDGGAGGGSGGSILLEAPAVSVDFGVLAANGGGGGGGGDGQPGGSGAFGATPASGGSGDNGGGAGGTDAAPENGDGGFDATGGGGGAPGRIRINTNAPELAGMVASPTPSQATL